MNTQLTPNALKVQQTLQAMGFDLQVLELPAPTRTAAEAAEAVGCQVGQIVKSLLFKTKHSQRAILVETSGANRVDERKLEIEISEPLGKADPDFVRQHTGFVIGGVPPVGHCQPIETYIDADLMQYSEIWAAAGTPHAVFRLAPSDLAAMTGGKIIEVKQGD